MKSSFLTICKLLLPSRFLFFVYCLVISGILLFWVTIILLHSNNGKKRATIRDDTFNNSLIQFNVLYILRLPVYYLYKKDGVMCFPIAAIVSEFSMLSLNCFCFHIITCNNNSKSCKKLFFFLVIPYLFIWQYIRQNKQ